MAPTSPPPTNNLKVLQAATVTGLSLWLLGTRFFLLLVILSTIAVIVWRWRFPCMTVEHLDTIVEDICSLIHVNTPHHDFNLLDVLPGMDAVRVNFEHLQSKLSILKRDSYEHEPRHTHLWSWLSFYCHQLFEIDKLYWGFRDVKMKILAAIEKERRQQWGLATWAG